MTDARAELTQMVRALTVALDEHEIDDATLAVLTEDTRALIERIEGSTADRFYDISDEDESAQRRLVHYRDHSLYAGRHNPLAPPMVFSLGQRPDGSEELIGEVTLDRRYEGPPHMVHGGYVAGLFDEMFGGSLRFVDDFFGVTGRLTVRYRKPTPIGAPIRFTAWIESVKGRRLQARAELHAADTLCADAAALFIGVPAGSVAR
jgi:acyl-coenzyme A thioesterase PaaI-like protein